MRPHSAPYSAHIKRLLANPVRIRTVRRWTESARGELHCCLEANGKHFEHFRYPWIHWHCQKWNWQEHCQLHPVQDHLFSQTKALVQYTVNVHSRNRKRCAAFKSGDIIDNKRDQCALKKIHQDCKKILWRDLWILTTCWRRCSSHWVRKRMVTWRGCRQQQNHVLYCV